MGMPSVNISFTEKAKQVVKRGERGIVALILRGEVPEENPVTVMEVTDIDSHMSADNKVQIENALIGYQKAPKKVICYFISSDAENYDDALKYFEKERFDYLVIPTVETDKMTQTVASWIKAQREHEKKCKAVLPNCAGDSEGIINFTNEKIIVGNTEFTTEQYCSRIAGLIAGTPLTIASTYAPLTEVDDCDRLSKEEMDQAVDSGKFFIFYDGEKCKVARGVNSFQTTSADKGNQFKKIKLVEAMDMIYDDIKRTAEDNYLGKYANSYDNKCILISAIAGYFEQLQMDGIISKYEVGINIPEVKAYLKEQRMDVSEMSDNDIKQADTADKVFLSANVKILDAIEEINLPILI